MRLKNIINYLRQQQMPDVSSRDALKVWYSSEDSLKFLLNTTGDDIPIYISEKNFYLYSVIVPLEKLKTNYVEDLLNWNFFPDSGYGYGYSYSNSNGEPVPFLSSPMENTRSKILDGSLPVFFLRSFHGYQNNKNYVEINQQISHVLDIHWVEEKHAWCKLNDLGEIVCIAYSVKEDDLTLCTLYKEELDFYLFLANACLVRVFDVSRYLDIDGIISKNKQEHLYKDEKNEIYARRTLLGDHDNPTASFLRGFQIIRCKKPRNELLLKLQGEEPRQYVTFIIWDLKHKVIQEWTSDPQKLGNYFVESDLPLEISPAFFKPDVLLRYRQDPSRYKIHERLIECKGAWSLEYDINEEGQVHVYIGDLSYLPYQEQLYWKAFNEPPKAGISLRAFKTDFEAEWYDSYDPLQSLKKVLEEFPQRDEAGNPCLIWKMPKVSETHDLTFLGYVVTESRKEWEDQIMALAQILVDGLNVRYINKLAKVLGCRDEELRSIKQLAKILECIVPPEETNIIIEPLSELWNLRSAIVAHPGGDLPQHDLREHFRNLVKKCDVAMHKLSELIKTGRLSYKSKGTSDKRMQRGWKCIPGGPQA